MGPFMIAMDDIFICPHCKWKGAYGKMFGMNCPECGCAIPLHSRPPADVTNTVFEMLKSKL